MRKFIQNKLKDQKGLTLIELLAVIVILAIIAAIAIPAISGIIQNSRVGAIKSDALNVINAAEMYKASDNEVTGTVTVEVLKNKNFLKDLNSFETNKTAITVNVDNMTLTGVAILSSGTSVEFKDATKSHITDLDNSAPIVASPGAVTSGAVVRAR